MTDFQSRAEALAQKALKRIDADKHAAANNRAAAWAKIQQTDTTLARFMTDFNREFGKPAAIKVEINGETLINQGAFAEPRRFFNGQIRQLPETKRNWK